MKNSYLILIAIVLISCGNSSYVAEKWENGQPKIVLDIHTGTKEKPEEYYFKSFYPNGKLFKEGLIKDTVEDGEWKTYYATGEVKSIGTYIEGEKTGKYAVYYRDGVLEQSGEYDHDSIVSAFLYKQDGTLMKVDSTEYLLGSGNPKWSNIEYATMHMECNMLFFDNWERGQLVCSCFIDIIQDKLKYSDYAMLTERQITWLMKYLMPEYGECIGK